MNVASVKLGDSTSLKTNGKKSTMFGKESQTDELKKLTASLPAATFGIDASNEARSIDPRLTKKFQTGRKGFGISKSSRTLSEPTLPATKSLNCITTPNVVSPTFARYMPYFLSSLESSSDSSTTVSTISVSNSSDASSNTRLPLSASQLSLPEPPDGGWGWVVVVAAFFVHMITDGVIVSFGVLIESLIEEFQDSLSATSWIGSFSYGVPALAAPLSSLSINRFGCRITCMLGGLISGLGCFAGVFTNSIVSLVFSFGILSGLGASLCITSALVVVSVYFDDRRATATGLSIAGTGVGALIFAPMVEMLLNIYTWRGAMMILSGFFLNMIVCGALMRPVETHIERRHRQRLAWLEHLARESGLPAPLESADYLDKDVLGRINLLRDHMLAPRRVTMSYLHSTNEANWKLTSGAAHSNLSSRGNHFEVQESDKNNFDNHCQAPVTQSNLLPIPEESPLLQHKSNQDPNERRNTSAFKVRKGELSEAVNKNISNHLQPETGFPTDVRVCQNKNFTGAGSTVADNTLVKLVNEGREATESSIHGNNKTGNHSSKSGNRCISYPLFCKENQAHINSDFYETNSLKLAHNISQNPDQQNAFSQNSSSAAFSTHRSRHENSMSLPDLHHIRRVYRSTTSSESEISPSQCSLTYNCSCCPSKWKFGLKSSSEDESCQNKMIPCIGCSEVCTNKRDIFHRFFDLRLFRRSTFALFMVSNFLLYFWYNVTYFFMGVRATNYGISETAAALLFSVLGGANMVGEVLAGFLADRDCVDSLTLYFFMILACGMSTCMMPFLTTFLSMAAYASVFGMGLAANDALCTVLLVEFVGLHRLTNGLGICFFCQGVANILGPPAIGKHDFSLNKLYLYLLSLSEKIYPSAPSF
uniref:MFS domain-containing protein n=1 Tax=Trichobilharzia regenti TaxID=157069 RepID=A0AA85JG51_TRIRE|nr:unnamed protein product [Trichobilharzia regenti]